MRHEWFKWYPAIYKADTAHLTAEQDGIYRRLIDYYMETRQPILNNDIAIARAAGIGIDAWAMAAAMIRPFFKEGKDGYLHHSFCDAQLRQQDSKAKNQSEKGKKGAKKRWDNFHDNQNDNSHGHEVAIAQASVRHSSGISRLDKNISNLSSLSSESPRARTHARDGEKRQDETDLIILIFEEEREKIFGERRDKPRKSDVEIVAVWIEDGATPEMCRDVFKNTMQRAYESGAKAPDSLKYFQDEISEVISKPKKTQVLNHIFEPEKIENPQWRAICIGLEKHLGAAQMVNWIARITFVDLVDKTLYLKCDNSFVIDHIKTHFHSQIRAVSGADFIAFNKQPSDKSNEKQVSKKTASKTPKKSVSSANGSDQPQPQQTYQPAQTASGLPLPDPRFIHQRKPESD